MSLHNIDTRSNPACGAAADECYDEPCEELRSAHAAAKARLLSPVRSTFGLQAEDGALSMHMYDRDETNTAIGRLGARAS
jgi:hypothetical protein